MKKLVTLSVLVCMFGFAGSVAAVDLNGIWEGYMYCSDDFGAVGEYFKVKIEQQGDFFNSMNITPTPGEKCGGVLQGNNIAMTCESGTFAYGTVKGKKLQVINHIPGDAVTCKGTAVRLK